MSKDNSGKGMEEVGEDRTGTGQAFAKVHAKSL